MSDSAKKPKEPSFEDGLKRLEAIVKELEQGELALERSLALYEEGTALNRALGLRLDDAERRIEVLTRGADGTIETAPFTPPEAGKG